MKVYYEDDFFIVWNVETGHDLAVFETIEDADDFIDNFIQ